MKKYILLFLSLTSIALFSAENIPVKRYAIVVGANNGGDERAILRYAESDAKMIADVFSDIGGIENSDSLVLLNPTKSSIERGFQRVASKIKVENDNTRTELIFYYSGHSNEEGLLIRGNLLSYKDLKDNLESTEADVKIGILDSCSSGAFTLLKGGKHSAPFLSDESTKTQGHAFITSASEDESAQESNLLQASFFTHFLVSALRGAADSSMDGKVSLHEAYSYASNETLARTEVTQAGAQHASYDFRLTGAGDLVLTDLRNAESNFILQDEDFGRFFIRDKEDNLISEVNKKYGASLRISVPSSDYTIIKEVDGIYYKQMVPIRLGETITLSMYEYNKFTPEKNVVRGSSSNQIEYELNVPEVTALFGWSTMDKVREANGDFTLISKAGSLSGYQISLANLVTNDAYGAQLSMFMNMNGGDLSGFQISGLFNETGGNIEKYGVQLTTIYNNVSYGSDSFTLQSSGIFNSIGSDTEGLVIQFTGLFNNIGGNSHNFVAQTSGLFNLSKNLNGFQISGLFNSAGTLNGLQIAGLFNKALNVHGAQISLVNVGDYVYGSQIGLININKDIKGLSLGLINVSTDGIKNFNYRYNYNTQDHIIDYQFGSSLFYHLIYAELPNDLQHIDRVNLGAGLGLHIPLGALYSEFDLSLKNVITYGENFAYEYGQPVINGKIALPLWDDLAIFAGLSFDFKEIIDNKGQYIDQEDLLENPTQTIFFGVRI